MSVIASTFVLVLFVAFGIGYIYFYTKVHQWLHVKMTDWLWPRF